MIRLERGALNEAGLVFQDPAVTEVLECYKPSDGGDGGQHSNGQGKINWLPMPQTLGVFFADH
jgi:hypothetical protein